jgi:hypothetical protein
MDLVKEEEVERANCHLFAAFVNKLTDDPDSVGWNRAEKVSHQRIGALFVAWRNTVIAAAEAGDQNAIALLEAARVGDRDALRVAIRKVTPL